MLGIDKQLANWRTRASARSRLRARHGGPLLLGLVGAGIGLGGCAKTPAERAQQNATVLRSWAAAGAAVVRSWAAGGLPTAYAEQTLAVASHEVGQTARRAASSPAAYASVVSAGRGLAARLDAARAVLDRGDTAAATGLASQLQVADSALAGLERSLKTAQR